MTTKSEKILDIGIGIILGVIITIIVNSIWRKSNTPTLTSFSNHASEGFPIIAFPGDTFLREGIKYKWTAISSDKADTKYIQYAWLTDDQSKKGCGEY